MNILFVADPLESFKTYKDTTFSMMREAQHRGHRIAACEPRHLVWRSGDVVRAVVRNITLTGRTTSGSTRPAHPSCRWRTLTL
jgi:glutathione synthase